MAASMGSDVSRLFCGTNRLKWSHSWRYVTQVTGNERIDATLETVTGGKIGGWLQKYEDIVGLTEVREAQNKVIQVGVTYFIMGNDYQKSLFFRQKESSKMHRNCGENIRHP
jgi:hypothetical protein